MSEGVSYVKVFTRDDGYVLIAHEDEPALDAAVTKFLETHVDELLSLTLLSESTYKVLASEITSWHISSPDDRARQVEIGRRLKDESGAPWESD